jgi:hypothetical protein
MRVLVACEESQTICKAFRLLGHEAYSCDIQACSGGHPEWHIKDDILDHLNEGWDLMIGHPPCTYLSYAGIGYFNVKKYGQKAIERNRKWIDAINFFLVLFDAPIERICLENPRSYVAETIKYSQIIKPFYFGDPFSKPTYLWLKNLPPLQYYRADSLFSLKTCVQATDITTHINKKGILKKHSYLLHEAIKLPPSERAKIRSKTFPGIANAMAAQWGIL